MAAYLPLVLQFPRPPSSPGSFFVWFLHKSRFLPSLVLSSCHRCYSAANSHCWPEEGVDSRVLPLLHMVPPAASAKSFTGWFTMFSTDLNPICAGTWTNQWELCPLGCRDWTPVFEVVGETCFNTLIALGGPTHLCLQNPCITLQCIIL